jgi:acetyltransferase-like isoleucine patch superfamily enzyme
VRIGEGCRIYSTQFSTEPYLVSLGDGVGIAGGVKFITHEGAARMLRSRRPMIQAFGRISVGDNTFIGENAIVLAGTQIGRDCIIAAGSVVRGKIADNTMVAGNPAVVIGRASLFLERLAAGRDVLDTFGLPEETRRRLILSHFGMEQDSVGSR